MTTEQMVQRELQFRYRLRAPFRWLGYGLVLFMMLSILLFLIGQANFGQLTTLLDQIVTALRSLTL